MPRGLSPSALTIHTNHHTYPLGEAKQGRERDLEAHSYTPNVLKLTECSAHQGVLLLCQEHPLALALHSLPAKHSQVKAVATLCTNSGEPNEPSGLSGLELLMPLPLPPEYWVYRCVLALKWGKFRTYLPINF